MATSPKLVTKRDAEASRLGPAPALPGKIVADRRNANRSVESVQTRTDRASYGSFDHDLPSSGLNPGKDQPTRLGGRSRAAYAQRNSTTAYRGPPEPQYGLDTQLEELGSANMQSRPHSTPRQIPLSAFPAHPQQRRTSRHVQMDISSEKTSSPVLQESTRPRDPSRSPSRSRLHPPPSQSHDYSRSFRGGPRGIYSAPPQGTHYPAYTNPADPFRPFRSEPAYVVGAPHQHQLHSNPADPLRPFVSEPAYVVGAPHQYRLHSNLADPTRPIQGEPLYVAVNPFNLQRPHERIYVPDATSHDSFSSASSAMRTSSGSPSIRPTGDASRPSIPFYVSPPSRVYIGRITWRSRLRHLFGFTVLFLSIQVPQQIYLLLLLRLPSLYFSRVTRLFKDANLSLPDIQRMAVANADQWQDGTPGSMMTAWIPDNAAISPHLLNFRHSWEGFIDSLLREWKTQNVVSALMLSAILTMLQIDAAASDPIARTTALLSLICALMSLLFGSMYIIRFGTMRKMYKAASWADEAQKESISIIWNVWILLAIPAVWLVWSIILFVTCIMAFTWRTGAVNDSADTALSHNTAQALRIAVSAVLAVALIYLLLIVKAFRKYGDAMDEKWNEKMLAWAREGLYPQIGAHSGTWHQPASYLPHSQARVFRDPRAPADSATSDGPSADDVRSRFVHEKSLVVFPVETTEVGRAFSAPRHELAAFPGMKVMDLSPQSSLIYPLSPVLAERDIHLADWARFTRHIADIWDEISDPAAHDPVLSGRGEEVDTAAERTVGRHIHMWNKQFFLARAAEAVLCKEYPNSGISGYTVYLTHVSPTATFGSLPFGLRSITVIHFVDSLNERQSSGQSELGQFRESVSGVPITSK